MKHQIQKFNHLPLIPGLVNELGLRSIPCTLSKKYINAILKCVVLTSLVHRICTHEIDDGCFMFHYDFFKTIYEELNLSTKNFANNFKRNILNQLTEYIECTSTGFYIRATEDYMPSHYRITDKFRFFIDKYKSEGVQYYKASITEILMKHRNIFTQAKMEDPDRLTKKYDYNYQAPKKYDLYHTSQLNYNELIKIQHEVDLYDPAWLICDGILELMPTRDGRLTQYYHTSPSGRYYQSGYSLQLLSKEYRGRVLSDYVDVDMKACAYFILYNLARQNQYEGDLTYLNRMIADPDGYRKSVYERLKAYDRKVTYSYVKTVFTSIAYGARCYEKVVENDLKHKHHHSVPVRTDGYSKKDTPLELVKMEEVSMLKKEIERLGNFLVKKYTDQNGYITNASKKILNAKNKSKGESLAHIVQGAEAYLLSTLLNYKIDDCPIKYLPFGIGLLLHDGLYLKKEFFKKIQGDGLPSFAEYLEEKTGFLMKF